MKQVMLHLSPRRRRYLLFSTTALLSLLTLTPHASHSSTPQSSESGWRRIFDGWLSQEPPEPPRNGGSRPIDGEGVCWAAPFMMPETAMVWSDRPTFTWQSPEGMITRLEVQPSDDRHPPLSYPISVEDQVRDTPIPTYQLTLEDALELGVTYEWRMYRSVPSQPDLEERIPRFVRFEILEGEERDRITTELAQLEATLTEDEITGDDATFQRALFFASQGLVAEMSQTLLSQPDPSETLEVVIDDLMAAFCVAPAEE
ncbi:MAG: hypothetical protein AAFX78_13050 [Cyanobacteria bacterium J06638_20]